MNKLKMKVLMVFIIGFYSMASYSAPSVWSGWYPVGQVYSYDDGSYFISLIPSSAHPNPAGCNSSSWMRVMSDQANAKDIFKIALTAQAAGLKINANIYGDRCAGSYVQIRYLRSVVQ